MKHVSAFVPTSRTIHPPPDNDPAGQALVRALGRPIGMRLSWSVVKSLVVSVLTFGVVPIFLWMRNFRLFAVAEQQQLLHLAKWLRASSSHPLAKRLEEDAEQLRPRWALWVMAVAGVVGTSAVIFNQIHDANLRPDHYGDALISGTYGFRKPFIGDYRVRPFPEAGAIFVAWIWGMTWVYACHWVVVQLHAQDVKRFVARFNEIAESEGLHRVKPRSIGVPLLAPLWVGAGILMVMMHAPWGLAAMVAGAAQRRYIHWTSRETRGDLAMRVRALLMRRGESAVSVPVPVYLRQRCVEQKCRAELPPGASFCRRCGTRQKVRVNQVA